MAKYILLLTGLLLSSNLYADEFEQNLSAARQALQNHNYEVTISLLEDALKVATTPQQMAQANNAIGWTYYQSQQYDKAKTHLEMALRQAKEAADEKLAQKVSNNLGLLEYTTGNLAKARSQFNDPASRLSATANTYLTLIDQQQQAREANQLIAAGVNYRYDNNFIQALAEYNKALAITPDSARALEYKGYALFRLQRYQEALAALQQSLRLDPNRLNTLINLFKTLCSLNDQQGLQLLRDEHRSILQANQQALAGDQELAKTCPASAWQLTPQ